MKQKTCDNCEYKGYSQEICKWHIKKMHCQPDFTLLEGPAAKMSKSAAYGAGIGALAVIAGVAAAPVLGLKALVAHIAVAKAGASGGVVGAGVNVARKKTKMNAKKTPAKPQKRTMVIPII
ncbi:magnetosome protein Mad7 [Candidatus Magnetomorum sp. HK-1]|nr:magnetosome protein Mad7 [Candidatus Magnetomorum sp. HK-1]